MTSSLKDSAGVDFDPAIHQNDAGVPRTTKAGRFFLKGRRKARALAGKPATKTAPQAPAEPKPTPAPESPELPPELRDIPPASEADILGRVLPPVTVEPEGVEPPEAPDETAPPEPPVEMAEGSYVPPDAPAVPAGESPPGGAPLVSEGLAATLITIAETSARLSIDEKEWELDALEKSALTTSLAAGLESSGLNPNTGPWGDFTLQLVAVSARRAPKPKTKAKLSDWWAHIKAHWFGAKKADKPLIHGDSQPIATA